jgi:hypothetical protein
VDDVDEAKIRTAIETGQRVVDVRSPIDQAIPQYGSAAPVMLAIAHVMYIVPFESPPVGRAVPPPAETPWRGSGSYSIGMTKPIAKWVRAGGVAAIRQAIIDGQKLVTVMTEIYPGARAEDVWPATFVVANIMMLTEERKPLREIVDEAGPKVTALWDRRK